MGLALIIYVILDYQINCISTEFTPKKHGGEKGVPFRIQIDTYSYNEEEPPKLLNCASCQIKVFKVSTLLYRHQLQKADHCITLYHWINYINVLVYYLLSLQLIVFSRFIAPVKAFFLFNSLKVLTGNTKPTVIR